MKISLNIIITVFILGLGSCTNQRLKKANKEYEHMHLQQAIKNYNKVLTKKHENIAVVNLANSYFLINYK